MSRTAVDLLRIVLPPWHGRAAAALRCAWRLPGGDWRGGLFDDMAALASRLQPRRLEICPHPADVSMTEAGLPPLHGRRLRAAVQGAVELLSLAPPDSLAIGFGPRCEGGKVPMAWMAAGQLSQWVDELAAHGLRVHAAYPPPAFLPRIDGGGQNAGEGAASAAALDDWAILRTGTDAGLLQPWPAPGEAAGPLETRLHALVPGLGQIHWLPADGGARWRGTGWRWTLPLAGAGMASAPHAAWLRPALGWGAAATAVWLTGLNLYAGQVEAQGRALKRSMAAQVKAVFPELPIVLNPLQQARQMRDARRTRVGTGTGAGAADDFASLLRASGALLAQAAGQVEQLQYQGGQLRLHWRDGAAPRAHEIEALQAQAGERGLDLESDAAGGLLVRAVPAAQREVAGAARPEEAQP